MYLAEFMNAACVYTGKNMLYIYCTQKYWLSEMELSCTRNRLLEQYIPSLSPSHVLGVFFIKL